MPQLKASPRINCGAANKRLQKGLNPTDKAIKVRNYVEKMKESIEVIAHSCGVDEMRGLNRTHVRIVQNNGTSIPMDELCPVGEKYESI